MNQIQTARRLTGLLCSARKPVAALSAAACVGVFSCVGLLLSQGGVKLAGHLANSEILSSLFAPKEQATAMQLLVTPAGAETFASYFNAIAPAVNNLDQPITRHVDRFMALAQAARDHAVTLDRFLVDTDPKRLRIDCSAPTIQDREAFLTAISASTNILGLSVACAADDSVQQFTITCDLYDAFYA